MDLSTVDNLDKWCKAHDWLFVRSLDAYKIERNDGLPPDLINGKLYWVSPIGKILVFSYDSENIIRGVTGDN